MPKLDWIYFAKKQHVCSVHCKENSSETKIFIKNMISGRFFEKIISKSMQSMKYLSLEHIFEILFMKNHLEIMFLMKIFVAEEFSLQ